MTAPSTASAPRASLWRPGENPAVDLVLFRQAQPGAPIEALMIRRSINSDACPGMLASPGGFINSLTARGEPFQAAETPRQAALRELMEETGLEREDLEAMIVQSGYYNSPSRDPRSTEQSFVSSCAFCVFLKDGWGSQAIGLDDADEARWFRLDRLGDETLAFDHAKVLSDAAAALGIELPVPLRDWAGSEKAPRLRSLASSENAPAKSAAGVKPRASKG